MKSYLIILLLIFSKLCYCQNIKKAKAVEITNKSVTKVLTSIESLSFEKGRKLEFSLFKISNGSGSAHVDGDDEISEGYLIGVTDSFGDEAPSVKYFSVEPFYSPKIISKKDLGDTYVITLQHGGYKNLKIHKITISLNNVTYQ